MKIPVFMQLTGDELALHSPVKLTAPELEVDVAAEMAAVAQCIRQLHAQRRQAQHRAEQLKMRYELDLAILSDNQRALEAELAKAITWRRKLHRLMETPKMEKRMDPSITKRASAANINPETGTPYGCIALDRLDQDVVEDLLYGRQAKNLTYEAAKTEYIEQKRAEYNACLISPDDPEFDEYFEGVEFHNQYEGAEEESHAGVYEDVHYQTFWLGGAQHLYVFKSPFVRACRPCSPCVPNAGDLDSEGTYIAYDVPPAWRAKE